jgi:hypothetical protein
MSASRGKSQRAEPIAALYEQNRVKHVGAFAELEDEACAMTANGYSGEGSPDRLDAMVWAISELMVGPVQPGPAFGRYGSGSGYGRVRYPGMKDPALLEAERNVKYGSTKSNL